MTQLRRMSVVVVAGLLGAGLLAACGSSTSSATTTAPPSTAAAPAGPGSTTTSGGPQNLTVTAADKAALVAAFVTARKFPPADVTGTQPGSVYYAYVPATRTYWALATFVASADPSYQTGVGMQDGGSMGVFSHPAGGNWTMVSVGSLPFCPSQLPLPSAVRAVWGLTDSPACSQG